MFFLHQIKYTNNVYDKGIVVKETLDAVKQSYHAYLGAYGYDHDPNTNFVSCMVSDDDGLILLNELWKKVVQPESELEPEVEIEE